MGLGLLIGLQREWRESDIAGIRTFPLIAMLGALIAIIEGEPPSWLMAAGLAAVAALLFTANLTRQRRDSASPGITTEVAALLTYVIGAASGLGLMLPAILVGGMVVILLHWKERLHGFVGRIGEKDIRAVVNLALIALVILPILPDQAYGPYGVLNPHRIWLMVVLIVGISMAAYVAYQLLGAESGAVVGGILGGLISSTATTVSYARQTRGSTRGAGIVALVIMVASATVNLRVLAEIAVVAPQLLRAALLPIAAIFGLMVVECLAVLMLNLGREAVPPEQASPAQLKPAIFFGIMYAVVVFLVAVFKDLFGDRGLYVIAAISGLTDLDAITLSTAQLFNDNRMEASTAWRLIVVGTMSNLVFKAVAVAVLGSGRLLVYIVVLFGFALAFGGGLLWFWPEIVLAEPSYFGLS